MLNRFRLLILLLPISLITFSSVAPTTAESAFVIEAPSCTPVEPYFITWAPKEVTCPVCNTKNVFMEPMSWGNYIYNYPSKYQLIFWPHTDSPTWHSCKKCKLTLFMGGFERVPKEKIADLQKVLAQVTLPAQKNVTDKEAFEHPPYLDIPVSARLSVAEKVYQTLDSTELFWGQFYRVYGYHLDHEGKTAEAAEARKKALKIAEAWLTDKTKEGLRKENLYICAAMRHFLQDDPGANKNLEEAAKLKYSNPELKAEQNENYNQYLDTLIKEYIDLIKKGEVPKY